MVPVIPLVVEERSEPVAHGERTWISGVPDEVNDTLAELIESELRMVRAIAGDDIDISAVVDGRRRTGHPHTAAAAGATTVVRSGAPYICRRVALREFGCVISHDPPGRPVSFSSAEGDDQRLLAAWLGGQRQTRTL